MGVLAKSQAADGRNISWRQTSARGVWLVLLALVQATLISFYHDPPLTADGAGGATSWVRTYSDTALRALLLLIGIYAVLNWHQRETLFARFRHTLSGNNSKIWLIANIAIFLAALLATVIVSSDLSIYDRWLAPYFGLLAILGLSLLFAAAPPAFWGNLVAATWRSIVLAILATTFAMAAASLSQAGWVPLAGATLHLASWLLGLYESNVLVNAETLELGVGSFAVNIAPECSGFEGVGLVTAVVGLYLYMFRRELAFPNALFLLPLGIAAIWLFNVLRIVALVSIGAHFSEQVAVGGFHSQAGWIAFLAVTACIMVMGHSVRVFRRHDNVRVQTLPSVALAPRLEDDALAWLAPFMALLAASILAALFQPHDQWLYGLRVLGIGAVLYAFRAVYLPLVARVAPLSLAAGLAVGIAWIATDPDPTSSAKLGSWLAALPLWAAALWLCIRAIGAIVLVPIAEELAFRGYLHRTIAGASLGANPLVMTLAAFVMTSLLFGLLHERWLAGTVAGAVYALVMYRSGRIADPIAAHMTSNAVIMAWAVYAAQWSLL